MLLLVLIFDPSFFNPLFILPIHSSYINFCPPLLFFVLLPFIHFLPPASLFFFSDLSFPASLCFPSSPFPSSYTFPSIAPLSPSPSFVCLSSLLLLPHPSSIGLSFQISYPWMSSFRSQTPRTQPTTYCTQCWCTAGTTMAVTTSSILTQKETAK